MTLTVSYREKFRCVIVFDKVIQLFLVRGHVRNELKVVRQMFSYYVEAKNPTANKLTCASVFLDSSLRMTRDSSSDCILFSRKDSRPPKVRTCRQCRYVIWRV